MRRNILLQDKNLLLIQSSNNAKYHLRTQRRHCLGKCWSGKRWASMQTLAVHPLLTDATVSVAGPLKGSCACGTGTTTVNKPSFCSPGPYSSWEHCMRVRCSVMPLFTCHFSHSDSSGILWFHRCPLKWGGGDNLFLPCMESLPPAW